MTELQRSARKYARRIYAADRIAALERKLAEHDALLADMAQVLKEYPHNVYKAPKRLVARYEAMRLEP